MLGRGDERSIHVVGVGCWDSRVEFGRVVSGAEVAFQIKTLAKHLAAQVALVSVGLTDGQGRRLACHWRHGFAGGQTMRLLVLHVLAHVLERSPAVFTFEFKPNRMFKV